MSTEAEKLLQKYRAGECTPEELEQLKDWFHDLNMEAPSALSETDLLEAKAKFKQQAETLTRSRRMWPRIAVAASILLALGLGTYQLVRQKRVQKDAAVIKPGGNKAILTLNNGKQIILTNAKNGLIANQAGTQIQKTAEGSITYQATKRDSAIQYNTLTTPRGGRYEGTLTDGTHFILDAASSITYPVQFNQKERIVTITGQAWFEVKHDPAHPFKVIAKGQTIEDIGTQFNVNAYDDEPSLKNTLVEGSIKVTNTNQQFILKPGQQTLLQNGKLSIATADIEEAIAWKNGQTTFKDEDLQTIMRQVSRWYDVDVKYEGQIPTREFAGGISRKADLKDLLKILSFYNVHYTLSNKTITVTP